MQNFDGLHENIKVVSNKYVRNGRLQPGEFFSRETIYAQIKLYLAML